MGAKAKYMVFMIILIIISIMCWFVCYDSTHDCNSSEMNEENSAN